jgi:carbonic anhydrase/acetyltransferase-like protein (isoleucine patch superfamily)
MSIPVYQFKGQAPYIDPDAMVLDRATLIGRIYLACGVTVCQMQGCAVTMNRSQREKAVTCRMAVW